MKRLVSFRRMEDGTREDYLLLDESERKYAEGLADRVLEATGSSVGVVPAPLPEDDPTRRRPDVTLAKELLGWEPVVGFDEGLARTIEHFRAFAT